MTEPRLQIKNLKISFLRQNTWHSMVDGVNLDIMPGEMLAMIGESGCGKSITALSTIGLLPPKEICRIDHGNAFFEGHDLYQCTDDQLTKIRGNRISMIFQEPMTALNPVFTIGYQLAEILVQHLKLRNPELKERCISLLESTGIANPERCLKQYPFELSGGMRQRVMIAMAIACKPSLIIADEPTTALDVTVQAQIMALLRKLQQQSGTSVLFITHNLALASQYADRCCVMYAGQIIESAATTELFRNPMHPYTRLLMQAIPNYAQRGNSLSTIAGMPPLDPSAIKGCRFRERCPYADDHCESDSDIHSSDVHFAACAYNMPISKGISLTDSRQEANIPQDNPPLLQVKHLQVDFPVKSGFLRRTTGKFTAVNDLSFTLHRGETLAIVGESGCGKTTTGKAIMGLIHATGGEILLEDTNLLTLPPQKWRSLRNRMQMIFQDPFSSLNPRLSVRQIISEGLRIQQPSLSNDVLEHRLHELLKQVGLPENSLNRYPHQFSGGQRQRIGLARALAVKPDIIICDECTSALDVSVQAQIINLLKEIQNRTGIAFIFITHDLGVVGYLASNVIVMNKGAIVETGTTEKIYNHPANQYTRELLSAAPSLKVQPTKG